MQSLARDDDPIIGGPIDRHARGDRDRALEQSALHRVGRADESQGPDQIRKGGGRAPGCQRRTGRIDERGVPRYMNHRVDARKDRCLACTVTAGGRGFRREQRNAGRGRTGALQLPHVLGAMAAAARHGDLEIRLPEHRIERADGQGQRRGGRIAAGRAVKLLRTSRRIAQHIERLAREDGGYLMMAMSIRRRAGEHGNDHLRPEPPDHIEHVFEDRVARPEAECLIGRLRESEIVRPREKLARPIELPGGEQLLGADDAELGAELGADQVLTAFTAR